MKKIIFVCLGNICRSPMAESLGQFYLMEKGLTKDYQLSSRATSSYEIGKPPHHGTQNILRQHHIPLVPHQATQITSADFLTADVILGMDRQNVADLRKLAPAKTIAQISLLLPEEEIPDPYYTGNFAETYRLIKKALPAWLQ
ncbi:low molecular weight protein-tyrosine-phosphatase [Enterococcus nangangensis]|uniref:low molecular weight protein-tyrosine-phosphatase n=1 Tax=Enterococcus nangangensis TaxID=2559926 RepID=UPI0010F592CF|nr:low molecular weight protein-tyrosine-phosphatase [Enterococcus nangangensis]